MHLETHIPISTISLKLGDIYSVPTYIFLSSPRFLHPRFLTLLFSLLSFSSQSSKLSTLLTDIEQLALLIGCFCHDLDHRGTNNAFQIKWEENLSAITMIVGPVAWYFYSPSSPQDRQSSGNPLFHIYHGAPPLRPLYHDPQQPGIWANPSVSTYVAKFQR